MSFSYFATGLWDAKNFADVVAKACYAHGIAYPDTDVANIGLYLDDLKCHITVIK